jgi:hypothetical protein
MLWLKRCFIILCLVLQPLSGFAMMERAHCDSATAASTVEGHHHAASASNAASPHHADHCQNHCKTGLGCCGACGAALTSAAVQSLDLQIPVSAVVAYTARFIPVPPAETRIKPPIA